MSARIDFLSEINQLRVSDEDSSVVENDTYIEMRAQVGRLLPSVDWVKIKSLAENVSHQTGMNVLTAVYYTVAMVKTNGLRGLACGLEVLFATIASRHITGTAFSHQHLEQLNWMLRAIKDDVKFMQVGDEHLRDLYRCERMCLALRERIGPSHPEYPPRLLALQDTLDSFIDCIELADGQSSVTTRYYVARKKAWVRWLCIFLLLVVSSVGALVIYDRLLQSNLSSITLSINPSPDEAESGRP